MNQDLNASLNCPSREWRIMSNRPFKDEGDSKTRSTSGLFLNASIAFRKYMKPLLLIFLLVRKWWFLGHCYVYIYIYTFFFLPHSGTAQRGRAHGAWTRGAAKAARAAPLWARKEKQPQKGPWSGTWVFIRFKNVFVSLLNGSDGGFSRRNSGQLINLFLKLSQFSS